MFFYDSSSYFCPCGSSHSETENKLPSNMKPHTLKALPDLYFCQRCQAIKCSDCCTSAIACKYCANCMNDYTDYPGLTRCPKNCFECPLCGSPVAITVHDDANNHASGKRFRFSCGNCQFSYHTKLVTKPAALTTILKNESESYFQILHHRYMLLSKLNSMKDTSLKSRKPRLTQELLHKMKEMDISSPLSDQFDEQDQLAFEIEKFSPRSIDIDADFEKPKKRFQPLGKHLSAKVAYSCADCGTSMLFPVADSRSMKFLNRELAVDTVPLVTAKIFNDPNDSHHVAVSDSDTQCVLNIVNPMSTPISIQVFSLAKNPPRFNNSNHEIQVSLPVTTISVPGRRDKTSLLDSIPTVFLGNSTQASRAELLARSVRRERLKKEECEGDIFLEKGTNWVSLPFTISVLDGTAQSIFANCERNLQIPFYFTVESKQPESWASADRRGLKFGFWVLCTIT